MPTSILSLIRSAKDQEQLTIAVKEADKAIGMSRKTARRIASAIFEKIAELKSKDVQPVFAPSSESGQKILASDEV